MGIRRREHFDMSLMVALLFEHSKATCKNACSLVLTFRFWLLFCFDLSLMVALLDDG